VSGRPAVTRARRPLRPCTVDLFITFPTGSEFRVLLASGEKYKLLQEKTSRPTTATFVAVMDPGTSISFLFARCRCLSIFPYFVTYKLIVRQAFARRSFRSFAGGDAVPLTITGEL